MQATTLKANSKADSFSYISQKDVCKRLGNRGYSTVDRDVSEGLMPPPVKIGGKLKFWPEHEVDILNAARAAGKSNQEVKEIVTALMRKREELFDSLFEKFAKAA